jgi:transglycosylase-like protein with SLT domain
MEILWRTGIFAAVAVTVICLAIVGKILAAPPFTMAAEPNIIVQPADAALSDTTGAISPSEPPPSSEEKASAPEQKKDQARLEQGESTVHEDSSDPRPPGPTAQKSDFKYLSYYVYSELPPERRPADIVLDSLKGTPVGTPIEEIKRAADAFGLDFSFMKAVAKIESDFDPKQRTGQYIGLFQLNKAEFTKYGSGEITNPRDNAIAAAYKFVNEATLFEWDTHKKPTFSDLYLIHQQGWQGAAEHVAHPERVAWQSMCATDEGREKGERWCKRAIWGNTLPAIKQAAKSVDKLTSGAFVQMWRERVDHLYARYSEAVVDVTKH